MSSHVFNVDDAKRYGVDAAIILNNFKFWLDHNKANKTHINDGYVWTYNSARAFSELFPYWSANKIQKLLKKLESDGVIITGNFNKAGYDKTKWYTLPQYSLQPNGGMESAKGINGSSQKAQPIPDVNTDVISDEINTDVSHPDKRTFFIDELCEKGFINCHDMIRIIKWLNDQASEYNYYTGSLTMLEWIDCEDNMRSVDNFDSMNYMAWWHNNKRKSMNKSPSLTNIVCDMNGIPFDQFYDSTFMQEWE